MRLLSILLILLLAAPALTPALAQDAPENIAEATEDRGRFIEFIENRLNTDNRIIRVSGIEGALSSRATIDLITIADREGVWLRLENSVIDWSRRQLLRGRLDIERLAAGRIEVLRAPLPDPNAVPSPEAGGFSIPELPLSIEIDALEVGELFLGEPIIGTEATVAINGSIALADGGLNARLAATRLDGPGGQFALTLAYAPETERFTVDLVLDEPADGLVANLAQIEGRPPVRFAVQGEGPLDDLNVAIALDAAGARLLDGSIVLAGTPEGRRITADLDGALAPLLPASVRDFVGSASTLDLVAVQREGGGLTVERAALDSGEVRLQAAARTTADGFLELLDLEAAIGAAGERTELPGGAASIAGATVSVDYGTGGSEAWTARAMLNGLEAGTVAAAEVAIEADGTLRNPSDPAARALSFVIDGDVRGLSSPDAAIAAAIGSQIRLDARGGFEAGGPVRLESASLTGKALRAVLAGVIEGLAYEGAIDLSAASLAPFSALAGRDLAGALALDANGRIEPLSGAFDLTLDGKATGLGTGIAAADALLDGEVALAGRLARDETGFTADGFTIDGEAVDVTANGTIASEGADFDAAIALADLSDLSERVTGSADVTARVSGAEGAFDVALQASVPNGSLAGRDLTGATVAFDGRLDEGDVRGTLSGDATLGGEAVSLSGEIATLGDIRQLDGFTFRAGEATATGTVRQNADGLIDGTLSLAAADVSTLAALALTEASGAARLDVALDARGEGQAATVEGTVDGLTVGETRVGAAEVRASIADLFGVPVIEGELRGRDIAAAGVEIASLNANADGTAERTAFEAEATLANGAEAELAGALRPFPTDVAATDAVATDAASEGAEGEGEADASPGFAIDLDRLALVQDGAELELLSPTTVTVADGAVALEEAALAVGGGALRASGSVGETIDLSLDLDAIGLDVVNAVRPDLAAAGTLTGEARLGGTPAAPEATFDLSGTGVTAAALRDGGVEPLALDLAGTFADGTLRVPNATIGNGQGVRVEANAVVPLLEGADAALMANLAIDALPLALANGFVDDLGAAGTASGMASVSGSLASPEATFNLAVDRAIAASLRDAGVEPLELDATGSFADGTIRLARASLTNPQGVNADVSGTVPLSGSGLDVQLDLAELPLAIGGVALPDLGLTGEVTGRLDLTGTLREPRGTFDVRAADVSADPLRDAAIAPLDAAVAGSLTATGIDLDAASVTNAQGLSLTADGSVPLGTGEPLALDVVLRAAPLALANAFVPDLDLSGLAEGTASLSGTLAAPEGTFDVSASRVSAAPLREAGIEPLALAASGELAGDTVRIDELTASNPQGIRVAADGTVPLATAGEVDVNVTLEALPLAIANAVAPDLELAGTVSGTASVSGPLTAPEGTFDVSAEDVTAAPLAANGIEPVDATARGELTGRTVRLDEARVTNPQGIRVVADGTVPLATDGEVDVDVSLEALPLTVANAVAPDLELDGTVSGTASVSGPLTAPQGTFDIAARGVTAAPLASNGVAPVEVTARGELAGTTVRLDEARVTNGQGLAASATGTVPLAADAPIDVDVSLDAVPLSLANAARPELELGGRVTGTASVEGTLSSPTGAFDIAGTGVTAAPLASNGVRPLEVRATGELLADRVVLSDARLSNAQGVSASASGTVPFAANAPINVDVSLDAIPLTVANAVRPELALDGTVSGTASVGGTLSAPSGTFDIAGRRISAARLRDNGVQPLDLDVAGSSDGRTVRLDDARLRNGQGIAASASGTVPLSADGAIDLDVRLDDVPLSVGNAVRPELGLGGRVSGAASVAGSLQAPRATFDIAGDGITATPLRDQGISPIQVTASGSSDGSRLVLEGARATNGQGIALSAEGTVPFDPNASIDIDVRLESLPLDALGGGGRASLGLGGRVTGSASVGGSVSNPRAEFDIDGSGITAAPLRDNGIDPLALSVDGSFADGTVRLASARASNGTGIDVSASGTVPLAGRGLSVQLDAQAPLSLADRFLVDRGARVGGQVQFSGSVTGSIADPSVNGLVSTQNATFVDPLSNLRVPSLDVLASVNDNVVTLTNARAVLGTGGTVSATGTIDLLDPGVPANLTVVLDDARYTDGENIVTTVDGRLTVTGGLVASPLIAGQIDVIETNVTVPESLGASADVLDVAHFRPPVPVMRTLERARIDVGGSGSGAVGGSSPSGVRLDVAINAPNRIFIRGRGLDAEVGGNVRLRGPISDVRPTGEFELIRGRLSILTQRITLDRGTVTLIGDLDPLIDFSATTVSGDARITISVTGRASDLDISFSSDPDLPEDEVLARLIFGRGLDELSPLQIARLAAAAAELSGRGGPGIFASLRDATGLDDLDVTTDAEGNAAVRAGRYVNDNIYLGVEAGQGGGRVTVDLDITDNLKARASTGADESTLGIFFEKDF